MFNHGQVNQIFSLNESKSQRLVQHEEMSEELIRHFQFLFTEPEVDRRNPSPELGGAS